jgi:hypothetical protein
VAQGQQQQSQQRQQQCQQRGSKGCSAINGGSANKDGSTSASELAKAAAVQQLQQGRWQWNNGGRDINGDRGCRASKGGSSSKQQL